MQECCAIVSTSEKCSSRVKFLQGEQPAIVDRDLFEAVHTKLSGQATNHSATRMKSEALLAGHIFDDRGNRMSPTYARKKGIKYRHYLSSVLLHLTAHWSRPGFSAAR